METTPANGDWWPRCRHQSDSIIIGFDSAWTDAPRAPGAICAVAFDRNGNASFEEPRAASFDQALDFIEDRRKEFGYCLVALDQPTIVKNARGCRPVERVAASVISYIGGGVQPSNTSRKGLFDAAAPIWKFLTKLGAQEELEASRCAESGLFLVEVYPALALPGLHLPFSMRLAGPKYNPRNRKKFRMSDWQAVAGVVSTAAKELGVNELHRWAGDIRQKESPRKVDQDHLDAAICALVGLIWRASDRERSAVIGDVESGYMVTSVNENTASRLRTAAIKKNVVFSTHNYG